MDNYENMTEKRITENLTRIMIPWKVVATSLENLQCDVAIIVLTGDKYLEPGPLASRSLLFTQE
jgi:hypothetical protein